MSQSWSDGERKCVADLLMAGRSMGSIARHLGVTRGVVIGRVHRDGSLHQFVGKIVVEKKLRSDASRVKPQRPPAAVPLTRAARRKLSFECVATQPPEAAPEPVEMLGCIGDGRGKPLVELKRGECRWPVGETQWAVGHFLFCGHATEPERPYCARHRQLARA